MTRVPRARFVHFGGVFVDQPPPNCTNRARRRRERGSSIVEFSWLTILLLVPFVYLLIAVFDVQRAAFGVSAASSAAARAFTQSSDESTGRDRARRAVDLTLADHDLAEGRVDVSITCDPACLQPGSTVRVYVRTVQRLPLVPKVFGETVAQLSVDSTHTEPYGTYRAGR